MNDANQSLAGPALVAAAANPESALPPEETLNRFTALLALQDDNTAFHRELVEFARAQTGARAALLLEASGAAEPRPLAVSAASVSTGFTTSPEVRGLAKAALTSLGSVQSGIKVEGVAHVLLGVAFDPGEAAPPQMLLLLLGPARAPFAAPVFTILHLLTRAVVERGQLAREEAYQSGFLQATLLVDLFSRAAQSPSLGEAVSVVARESRQFVGCARVAVGIGRGTRLRVEGLSGFAKVEARSHGTRLLAASMRESMGLDKAVAWPAAEEAETRLWPSTDQTELLEAFAARQMVTLPLVTADGRVAGAWMFLFKAGEPLTLRKLALMEAATPHAAALLDLIRQGKPSGWRGAVRRFWAGASRHKRTAILAAGAAALGLLLMPVPHRVSAPCEVHPRVMRQVAAPFDSVLEEVFVKPGELVESGHLLARLDGKEIGWRHARALADREMALKKRDLARASSRDVAEVQMAQLEADAAGVQVDLLEYQKANLEIRSPLPGFILSGSLERSKGVPVSMGQKLFEISPIDVMDLEIAVADSDVGRVAPGMELTLRLESRPREKRDATLQEVYPVSETKDSGNVFIGIAEIGNPGAELRPGMRGRVKIHAGYKPLGWVLFHRPWDFLRLHL